MSQTCLKSLCDLEIKMCAQEYSCVPDRFCKVHKTYKRFLTETLITWVCHLSEAVVTSPFQRDTNKSMTEKRVKGEIKKEVGNMLQFFAMT